MQNKKFIKWLENYGCEILPPSNEYEAVRWRGKKVGIFYTSGKCNSEYARKARKHYKSNLSWDGGPVSTGRKKTYLKEKEALLERDGDCCFFCGEKLGDDITIEHLIALSRGGQNYLSNMVLAHSECNNKVGNMSISDKFKYALKTQLKKHGL